MNIVGCSPELFRQVSVFGTLLSRIAEIIEPN
jgi:hypothetical protein